MEPDADPIQRWSSAAPFWEKHREAIRQMFAPVTHALIEAAQIETGHAVLDVATGPGEPALTIASLIGREGKVVGVDPATEMVEAARREAERLRLENAQFQTGAAEPLPFAAGAFDAAVSRFGVMFFPSPVGGVREMLRVLKPGGRVALAAWSAAEQNPFFHAISRAVERHVESPPAAPDALEAFRFAEHGKLRAVVEEAGALDCSERILSFTMDAPMSAEDFWTVRVEMSETIREKLSRLTAEQVDDVRRQAIQAIRAYSADHGIRVPSEVLIVSGRKGRAG